MSAFPPSANRSHSTRPAFDPESQQLAAYARKLRSDGAIAQSARIGCELGARLFELRHVDRGVRAYARAIADLKGVGDLMTAAGACEAVAGRLHVSRDARFEQQQKEAVSLYLDCGEKWHAAEASQRLGEWLVAHTGRAVKGLRAFQRAASLCMEGGFPEKAAELLEAAAAICFDAVEGERFGCDLLEKAAVLYAELGDGCRPARVRVLCALGEQYERHGMAPSGRACFEQALAVCDEDSASRVRALRALGRGDPAAGYFEEAAAALARRGNARALAETLEEAASTYAAAAPMDVDGAEARFRSARQAFLDLGDERGAQRMDAAVEGLRRPRY